MQKKCHTRTCTHILISVSKDVLSIIHAIVHHQKYKSALTDIVSYRRLSDRIEFRNSNDELHRDGDLPAVIFADGDKQWYKNGVCHRDGDLPAVIYSNGDKVWYKNSKLHRDGDLPAVICADGTKYWFKNGQCHRDGDLPALIYSNGDKWWFKNGKRVR